MSDSAAAGHGGDSSEPAAARVVANFGATVAFRWANDTNDSGPVEQAVPLRQLPLLVAGDRVQCAAESGGAFRVTALEPRSSALERADHRGRAKPLAANLSHLAIVSAAPPGIDTRLIDEFCVSAWQAGIDALVVINKADLLDVDERSRAEAVLDTYRQVGHPAVMIDAKSDAGLEPLRAELGGRSIALVGASGVGKSSIVKRLLPDLDVRIGAVSRATGLGAHTTSVTFCYALPGGGTVVDSPGVRRYAVAHIDATDVRAGFREMARLAEQCRFGNCSHVVEPACAVRDAVESGEVAAWRYENYRALAGI